MIFFFFFNDTATTEIYTLSLHDALPIFQATELGSQGLLRGRAARRDPLRRLLDRKSTRLNSSHSSISYAVFCLKKKKTNNKAKIEHLLLLVQRQVPGQPRLYNGRHDRPT